MGSMEPMHWEYLGALGGVIGIGWLVVVPMYRGWSHLNQRMTAHVMHSASLLAQCDQPVSATPPPTTAFQQIQG
jgi:hypothetical protein